MYILYWSAKDIAHSGFFYWGVLFSFPCNLETTTIVKHFFSPECLSSVFASLFFHTGLWFGNTCMSNVLMFAKVPAISPKWKYTLYNICIVSFGAQYTKQTIGEGYILIHSIRVQFKITSPLHVHSQCWHHHVIWEPTHGVVIDIYFGMPLVS